MDYLWFKAFHVAAVLVFAGGLSAQTLALSAAAWSGPPGAGGLALLSRVRAWDRRVTSPALLGVWGLGIYLAISADWFEAGWLQTKLVLVLLLSGLHGVQAGALRRLVTGAAETAPRRLRWSPIIVAAAFAGVALLAVGKPL